MFACTRRLGYGGLGKTAIHIKSVGGIYTPELTLRPLAATGYNLTAERLAETAYDVYQAKFAFKLANSLDFDKLSIPQWVFERPAVLSGFDEAYMRRAIAFAANQLASPRA
jgi:hypothetical protein